MTIICECCEIESATETLKINGDKLCEECEIYARRIIKQLKT